MQTENTFEQIWLDTLDDEDITALQLAVSISPFGHTVEGILADVANNESQLWRGTNGDKRFVMITQLFRHPGGMELKIWSVGGQGYTDMQ